MSFTTHGLAWIQASLLPALREGRLCVGDGDGPVSGAEDDLTGTAYAEASVDAVEDVGPVDVGGATKYRLLLRATFGEGTGNFDWREKGVKLKDGTLVERSVEDGGRKVEGSVWTLEIAIDLVP